MSRVIVFGTFDIFHLGHENFFIQAKNLGDYLLVVVARDKYVREIKGKHSRNSEVSRLKQVRESALPNKVILGSKTYNYYHTIRSYKIDTIALGYDQTIKVAVLKKLLRRHRLSEIKIKRLIPFKPHIYKTKLLLK